MQHLMSPLDLSVEELDKLLTLANDIEKNPQKYAKAYYYYNAAGGSVTGLEEWWTMTPYDWYYSGSTKITSVFPVHGSEYPGVLGPALFNNVINGIRPVLSLKSCVLWKSGDGTSDNPYTVDTLDSACSAAEN